MFERMLLLILNHLLEGAEILRLRNLDREDLSWIIAEYDTVKIEIKEA